MRHRLSGYKLSRDTGQRTALLRNLSSDLLTRGYIVTTVTKAKFTKNFIDKIISKAKKGKLSDNRKLASFLTDVALSKLLVEIAPGFSQRQSGFTRIIKLGNRQGDAAPTARLEILNLDKKITPEVKKPKTRKTVKASGKNNQKSISKKTKSNK